jgi:hypothetical protein
VGITLTGEVTGALGSPWLTGSANVGQSATDNGNGTETVVIWDKTPMSSAQSRNLRLKITQP